MSRLLHCFICLIFIIAVIGCGTRNGLAPVSELKHQSFSRSPVIHIVHRGETLYAIAFGYDIDYQQLVLLNHLNPPYKLQAGQKLRVQQRVVQTIGLKSSSLTLRANPHLRPKLQAKQAPSIHSYRGLGWYWPVRGRVVATFIPQQGKKGINIASYKNAPIHAAASGIVAYAGSGLSGYGNLIIIKHNNDYLTAYGHNAKNLVSEGQPVRAGQVIAVVGMIDHQYWGIHFEIRNKGIPVNPLNYLQKIDR